MSGFARGQSARPLLYGHRGTRKGAPENTLRAIRRALDQGADGIELDVRLCASGEVVVLHDPDLQRVAGANVRAAEASFDELRRHDLGQGERVPSLDEAMELVLGAGRLLNVELKGDVPDTAALVARVAERTLARSAAERARIIFSSFDASICRALRIAAPEIAVGFLFERVPARLPDDMTAVHPYHAAIDRALTMRYVAAGLVVNVWTVNDSARAAALAQAGVDGIITDDLPAVLAGLAAIAH